MTKVPLITDRDIEIVMREFGDTEASRRDHIIRLKRYVEEAQPEIFGFLDRCFEQYGHKPWFGYLAYLFLKTFRIIEFAYSRQFPPEGACLPVVGGDVGAPMQRDVFTRRIEYLREKTCEFCVENPLLAEEVACDTLELGIVLEGADDDEIDEVTRLIYFVCVLLYKMIDNQINVDSLDKSWA